ncbi:MAG: redoxin domain-containing protein [Rhizobiaceae bacterium]|nr:redoxin domain-containing protein [Rhizobiaceae bacterium]
MPEMSLLHRWIGAGLIGAAMLLAAPAQAQMPKPGDKAPAFSVNSTTGKPVALADFLGRKNVVLFFYIAAFTDT